MTVHCGGTSLADYALALKVFVDAAGDAVVVTAASRDNTDGSRSPFSLTASLTSVRPSARFHYSLDFQCDGSSSGPDVFLALPPPAPPGNVAIFHVNDVAGGDNSLFNSSMHQQGLAPLLSNFSDPLDGRIFGAARVGASGADGRPQLQHHPRLGRARPRVCAAGGGARGPRRRRRRRCLGLCPRQLAGQRPVNRPRRGEGGGQCSALDWGEFWRRSYLRLGEYRRPRAGATARRHRPSPAPLASSSAGATVGTGRSCAWIPTAPPAPSPCRVGCMCLQADAHEQGEWVVAAPCDANKAAPCDANNSQGAWKVVPCTAGPAAIFGCWRPSSRRARRSSACPAPLARGP